MMDPAREQQKRTAAISNNVQQWVSTASEQNQRNGLARMLSFPLFSQYQNFTGVRVESDHKIAASQKWQTWYLSTTCLNRCGEMQKSPNKTRAISQMLWKVRGCSTLSVTGPGMKPRTWRECWWNPEICWQRLCIRATSNSPDSRDGYLCWL